MLRFTLSTAYASHNRGIRVFFLKNESQSVIRLEEWGPGRGGGQTVIFQKYYFKF